MVDQCIEKMADLIVNYSVAVKPGDNVFVRAHVLAEPMIREVNKKVLQAGGFPFIWPEFSGLEVDVLKNGSTRQIEHIPEPISVMFEKYDCLIRILAEDNTRVLSSSDPAKMAQFTKARGPIMKTYMDRSARGELL